MRYKKFYLLLIIFSSALLFSCSEIQDEISTPQKVSVHGMNVYNPTADNFHGIQTKKAGLNSCTQCHAADYKGGVTQVSCANPSCHPSIIIHNANIMNPSSENFHGRYIAGELKWQMTECQSCHGTDYSGGVASPTCNSCHKNSSGPEACNTCHGEFLDASKIAPPRGLENETLTSTAAVGAHTLHLKNVKIGKNVECIECHTVPSYFGSPGHIDDGGRAEVKFSGWAVKGVTNASYNLTTLKCDNTYCHGNFAYERSKSEYPFVYEEEKIVGNNYSPVWNKVDGSEAKCGTCHGLPPKGHIASDLRSCATCHVGVVNNLGAIIDPVKHMDGKPNVFGK